MKDIILILLITLSIWQTSKLWLGSMPGPSFFVSSAGNTMKPIEPESIWIVPGAPGTLVYRLGEGNREYQSVRNEIEDNIINYLPAAKIGQVEDLNWEATFEKKGILYQYPFPITYGEMIGSNLQTTPKNKIEVTHIDYVFIQLADDYRGTAKWQLISSQENKSISVEVLGQFENMKAFNDLLKEETLTYKVKYQPTFNMVGMSNKNLFLPIASQDTPIVYNVLEWYNPLANETELTQFNPYVNSYFLNPLLKKEEITENGTYIFSELMKAVVKYYPSGVFEYSNIGATQPKNKISRLEAYNISQDFLSNNESLVKDVKRTLFLSKVEETGIGYIFYYDMHIEGIPTYFSKRHRKELGMNHMAEVKVEGRQVANFKWNAAQPKIQKSKQYGSDIKTENFTMKYTDGINKVLEHIAANQGLETLMIDDMRWVYMIDGVGKDVDVRWIIQHDNEWYSP